MIALALLLGCPKSAPYPEIEAVPLVTIAVTGWEVTPGEPPALAVDCAVGVAGDRPVDGLVLQVHVVQVDADIVAYSPIEGRLPAGGPTLRRVSVPIADAEVSSVEATAFKATFARQ